MDSQEVWNLENGEVKGLSNKEGPHLIRNAHTMSSSSLRKRSDPMLLPKVRCRVLRQFLNNLQEVILGTKLCLLFPAIPLAVLAKCYQFGRVSSISFFDQFRPGNNGCCLGGRFSKFSINLMQVFFLSFCLILRSFFLSFWRHTALDFCSEFNGADTASWTCQLSNWVSLHVYQKKFIHKVWHLSIFFWHFLLFHFPILQNPDR